MHRLIPFVTAALSVGGAHQTASAIEPVPDGKARYELFGLLSDDWITTAARRQDAGRTVERFWPGESRPDNIARFERVLGEVCKEEGIDSRFRKETNQLGFLFFYSVPLATLIRHQYTDGHLRREVLGTASRGDLLRYVAGAYSRAGDKQGAAIIYPQSRDKASVLGHALKTLGCSRVRLYFCDGYPGTHIVTFSPSSVVRQCLGICTAGKLHKGPSIKECVEQIDW